MDEVVLFAEFSGPESFIFKNLRSVKFPLGR